MPDYNSTVILKGNGDLLYMIRELLAVPSYGEDKYFIANLRLAYETEVGPLTTGEAQEEQDNAK